MRLAPAVAVLAGFTAFSAAPHAHAQSYPVKPVRVIVSWPAGASNDIVGRVVAQRLSENLGQTFVVENRAGAASIIGTEAVAKSPPDGYTMLVNSATFVSNAHLYKKLPYDPFRDFVGVSALGRQVGILVAHPSLPAKNTKELIALARARPNQVIFASAGAGSFTHFGMALFNEMTNTKMLHVAYKGGGPAVIAIVAGETHVFVTGIAAVLPHLKSQRLRGIGVTSAERNTQVPDIPALAETIPGYEFSAWIGAFVPAATPRPIVEKLNAEVRRALEHPDVAKNLGSQTLDPMPMTLDQFAALLKSDYQKYERLVKASGIKIE